MTTATETKPTETNKAKGKGKNEPVVPEKRERATANQQNDTVKALRSAIPTAKFTTVNLDQIHINKANNIRDLASKSYSDDEIADMMQQIEAAGGVMQSILLAQIAQDPATDNKPYALVMGFRRCLALKKLAETNPAYKENIPALIVPAIASLTAMKIMQLLENVARVDLTPIEEAQTIESIVSDQTANLQYKDVAALLGKSPPNISQLVKILKFPKEVQNMIHSGELSFSHARDIQQFAPESKWVDMAKTGATMTHGAFQKFLRETFDTSEGGETGEAAEGSGQKAPKMVKSTEVKNSWIPWLTKRVEAANATEKKFTAKDLEQARLDVFKTVMLEETPIVKEIQPFLEEQKKAEEQAAKDKEATDKKEEFLKKAIKAVDEIVNAKPDPEKPDAPRPNLSEAWGTVAQRVYKMSAEEKAKLGFELPKEPKEFLSLLGTAYTNHAKELRENAAKRQKAKEEKEAKEKAEAEAKAKEAPATGEAAPAAETAATK